MRVEYVRPFIAAAMKVLEMELGSPVGRGELTTDVNHFTNREISVLIGLTGEVEGTVIYGLRKSTAIKVAEAMVGEKQADFDDMAESAIAELGNIISGQAAMIFDADGLQCDISPPTIVVGRGTRINTVGIPRLVAPLETELGEIEIVVSLQGKNG